MEKKKQVRKVVPQDWDLPAKANVPYKIWRALFAAIKIASGALATVLLIVVVAGFVFVGMLGDFLQNDVLPDAALDLDDLTVDLNSTIYYVDENGQFQVQQEINAQMDRKWVGYDKIPQNMINAAVAVEDHRFYKHQGVDWVTTLQACARMFFGDSSAGGSSITQQLIKNTFGNPSVTVQRKLLEIFQATQMEKSYDKRTIMEYYLNIIYLGQNCNGIKAAAETYYGKELDKLTAAECASIIAITNSPTYYDPYQNPENNWQRTRDILWFMRNQGYLTEAQYQLEMDSVEDGLDLKYGIDLEDRIFPCESCGYRDTVSTLTVGADNQYYCPSCSAMIAVDQNNTDGMYSYHTEMVIKDVAKALAEKDGVEWTYATQEIYMRRIQNGGFHIYSTMDAAVQEQVEKIYTNYDNVPSVRGAQMLQSAIVVIDNRTGDIVGVAGGTGEKTEYFGWDRSQAPLQTGSSIKPLTVYAPGFEKGTITPATVMKDLPFLYSGGSWPRNDNWIYNYSRTIYSAITSSVNAVCTWTLDAIGTDYSFDFAKNKFQLHSLVDSYIDSQGVVHTDNGYAPLGMGAQTWGITVREMANAYSAFANDGIYREGRTFTKVFDSRGNLVLDNTQYTEQILSEKTVNYMNYCLVNATANGTGTEANLKYSYGITTAGKTGTTDSKKARWYCGYTGHYTAAVWTGFDQPDVISPLYCDNPAAVLFQRVMGPIHKGKSDVALYNSYAMRSVSVCLDSGKLATGACSLDVRSTSRVASALVYPEDYPKQYCTKHTTVDVCSGGGVANDYCHLFAQRENQPAEDTVTITEKSLVKVTEKELDAIRKAANYGLAKFMISNEWIYQVNENGGDSVFLGFYENLKQEKDAPYLVCPVHNEKTWKEYQESQIPEPEPTEGTDVPIE